MMHKYKGKRLMVALTGVSVTVFLFAVSALLASFAGPVSLAIVAIAALAALLAIAMF